MDIQSFTPLVRLYEVLREKGLLTIGQGSLDMMQNRMEALIVALEMFCFKEHLSVEDLVSRVTNIYNTADNLGIPIQRFPSYITELKDRIDTLTKEMDRIEANKQAALRDYGMTLEFPNRQFRSEAKLKRQRLKKVGNGCFLPSQQVCKSN